MDGACPRPGLPGSLTRSSFANVVSANGSAPRQLCSEQVQKLVITILQMVPVERAADFAVRTVKFNGSCVPLGRDASQQPAWKVQLSASQTSDADRDAGAIDDETHCSGRVAFHWSARFTETAVCCMCGMTRLATRSELRPAASGWSSTR